MVNTSRKSTRSHSIFLLLLLLLPLFGWSIPAVYAQVRVRIMNRLGNNTKMHIHCQSHDDDFGLISVADGLELEWKFTVNFWGTTLFYCDVKWDRTSGWHHFDAYSYEKDSDRCPEECIWMITNDGLLFGYNQQYQIWELMPFSR